MAFKYELYENPHELLKLKECMDGKTYLTRERYNYFHYCCDLFNDRGFGCGYRVIQSIASMLKNKLKLPEKTVPTIIGMQKILIRIGDKPESFLKSRDWIGSLEAAYIFDEVFKVNSKIIHIPIDSQNRSLFTAEHKNEIVNYFVNEGGLIFMGGETDASAKLVVGAHVSQDEKIYLLVIDPHFDRIPSGVEELIELGYVQWKCENELYESSFYNMCMPLIN